MNLNKQILALLIILIANSATILAMDAGDAPEDMAGKIKNFDGSSKKITKERRKKMLFFDTRFNGQRR